ncbi:MAG TPA: hypothetical protein VNI58_03540, partial [Mariprofundaceae bacterium]|nr:hypothetical protein [Mariprofundaceae bacterium]
AAGAGKQEIKAAAVEAKPVAKPQVQAAAKAAEAARVPTTPAKEPPAAKAATEAPQAPQTELFAAAAGEFELFETGETQEAGPEAGIPETDISEAAEPPQQPGEPAVAETAEESAQEAVEEPPYEEQVEEPLKEQAEEPAEEPADEPVIAPEPAVIQPRPPLKLVLTEAMLIEDNQHELPFGGPARRPEPAAVADPDVASGGDIAQSAAPSADTPPEEWIEMVGQRVVDRLETLLPRLIREAMDEVGLPPRHKPGNDTKDSDR